MTRIENVGPQDRESFRKEIRGELRSEDRRKVMIHFGGCALFLFLLIAVPTVFVAWTVAETGLVNVPVLSPLVFKPAEPSRTVLPLVGEKPDQILQIVATRATFDPATSYLTVPIREDELTTVVRDGIANAPPNTLPFPVKDAQIAIDDTAIEVFVTIVYHGRETTVLAHVRPTVVNGQLSIDAIDARLGSLTLPHWAMSALMSMVGQTFFSSLQSHISTFGKLENVVLQKGTLQLVLRPNQQ